MAVGMPGESQVPPGPHRDLLQALHALYRDAGKPGTRAISAAIQHRDDLPDTVSHETVGVILRGAGIPGWLKLQSLVRQLTDWAVSHPDADGTVQHFHRLWLAASEEAGSPPHRPAAGLARGPQTYVVSTPIIDDGPDAADLLSADQFDVPAWRPKCLPVYLVIDASESMRPFRALLQDSLVSLHQAIAHSPRMAEFARLSILAISATQYFVTAIIDVENSPGVPSIACHGRSDYTATFDLVRARITTDIDHLVQQHTVLRPSVFFFTAGTDQQPDEWAEAYRRLTDKTWHRRPHIIGISASTAGDKVALNVATKAALLSDTDSESEFRRIIIEVVNSLLNSLAASRDDAPQGETADGFTAVQIEEIY